VRATCCFLATMLVVATSCSGSPSASTPSASAPTTVSPSPASNTSVSTKIVVDGLDRFYSLFVPRSLDRSKAAPLVIYLHGSGQTATAAEEDTQLSAQAEQLKFVAAYPQALSSGWNHGCCNASFNQKIDDVAFMHQIIRRTSTDLPIDTDRIYIAGWSAGASLAYHIACDAPESFAAIGAVSGGLTTAPCSPRAAVSIMEIHGTKDAQVPYGGCSPTTTACGPRDATIPPTDQMIASFRGLFACPAPTIQRDGVVTRAIASACRDGTEVTLITAEGGLHASPLGSATGRTLASAEIPELLKFFFAHRRPAAR
jgi:polyhydroxybutyrate depolymerase